MLLMRSKLELRVLTWENFHDMQKRKKKNMEVDEIQELNAINTTI